MDYSPKAAYTVSEMCRLLQMSRTNFYEHVKRGTFHAPGRLTNNRPFFTASQVADNLKAKELSVGVNGEYVLFYVRQPSSVDTHNHAVNGNGQNTKRDLSELIAGLKALGVTATPPQVDDAVTYCFPKGTSGCDETEVLRTVFRHLKRSGAA